MIILATSYYSKLNKGVCAAHPFLKTHCLCIPLHCRRSKGLHTVMKSTLFHISPGKNNRLFFFFYHMLSLIFPWWYCLLVFFGFQKYYTTFYYLALNFPDILKSLLSCFPAAFLSISAGISPRSVLDTHFFPLLTNDYFHWQSEGLGNQKNLSFESQLCYWLYLSSLNRPWTLWALFCHVQMRLIILSQRSDLQNKHYQV